LTEQGRLNPSACFVFGPQVIAKGLNDVIGSDANVCCAFINHLQYTMQYADSRAKWFVLALVESPLPVKVAKEFIGPVDKVNDHSVCLRLGFIPEGRKC